MQPNILFLMTDQQRWDALGSMENWIKTPYLDRLVLRERYLPIVLPRLPFVFSSGNSGNRTISP